MMGQSCFPGVLLVSLLFLSCFSCGSGRKLMDTVHHEDSPRQEAEGIARMTMIEVMDYAPPEANKNPKTEFLFSPPPPRG